MTRTGQKESLPLKMYRIAIQGITETPQIPKKLLEETVKPTTCKHRQNNSEMSNSQHWLVKNRLCQNKSNLLLWQGTRYNGWERQKDAVTLGFFLMCHPPKLVRKTQSATDTATFYFSPPAPPRAHVPILG